MSDVINPEHECPFDPKNYQCDCFIAPVGSFSWALIQLKLRKRVARSVWGDKGMYLAITPRVNELTVEEGSAYAVDGVAVGTKYDYLSHIVLRNEHGNFVPWQPTQEDMMTCDWAFMEEKEEPVKPEPHMMIFDLTLGIEQRKDGMTTWGYWGKEGVDKNNAAHGSLNVIQNKTDIEKTVMFFWFEDSSSGKAPVFNWNVLSRKYYQTVDDLFSNKNLYVTVDDVAYNLGKCSLTTNTDREYEYVSWYENNAETEKLGEVLKQTGKTKRFYCNWR
ncbi:DUF2829 domain-containing protein [Xenorhabdus bovienii]|uniref:DUF2829 domain-containing protein n=1 Tax=Xenorhabdus bovienii TaxID=40576 RepID=A0AAJ1N1H7_XENBV|nr:DUF2829 domain-containing protein [Xenorhabdus bovienii]MDE1479037.1 DUF2829 domain-containing protein [Xenorhabdus bovienii]MDE9510742.1 DUF2829 domain-containing protein [Xenorhabdus bovienii]MDE9522349.1 DUF2829 domain-containing protein [Xenorhabdus bovienii]